MKAPSIPDLLKDPSTPSWVVSVIRTALTKDAVDAANVLSVLAAAFEARAEILLRRES